MMSREEVIITPEDKEPKMRKFTIKEDPSHK